MEKNLINEITKCTHFCNFLKLQKTENCCSTIINFQKEKTTDFLLPEPFSGDLFNAPILFISSNPSFSLNEMYPTEAWPSNMINDFFINRFKDRGEEASWVFNNKSLNKNGRSLKSVKYWSSINKRAKELLGRDAIAGVDYCITEIVHCKSVKEIGVKAAKEQCNDLYLKKIITSSNAKVIIAIGNIAKKMLNSQKTLFEKPIYYLPHPNAFKAKTFEKTFNFEELQNIKKIVLSNNVLNNIKHVNLPTVEEIKTFIKGELLKEESKYKKKKIVYLHGLDSKISDEKRKVVEFYGEILAPDIDYYNNPNCIQYLYKEYLDIEIDYIIGSSIGGFTGYYLSKLLNKTCLLFNPALPYQSVQQNIPIGINDPNNEIQIVIGNKDNLINAKENLTFLLNEMSLDNKISIQIINQLEHSIPLNIFKNELESFFLKY